MDKVRRVVMSKISDMFVLKVEDEYDYLFISEKKAEIILHINEQFSLLSPAKTQQFLMVEQLNLKPFVMKKKLLRKSSTIQTVLYDEQYKEYTRNKLIQKLDLIAQMSASIMTTSSAKKTIRLVDFQIVKIIGRGGFGKVFLVKNRQNQKYYAMKSLKKDEVI